MAMLLSGTNGQRIAYVHVRSFVLIDAVLYFSLLIALMLCGNDGHIYSIIQIYYVTGKGVSKNFT